MRQTPDTCAVAGPNQFVTELVAAMLEDRNAEQLDGCVGVPQPICYAEIGVYQGATVAAVARLLPDKSTIHLYDFKDRLEQTQAALEGISDLADRNLDVHLHPNTRLLYDSYNWTLAKALNDGISYDFVYIDGAHTWHHDALAFFLIDRMLKPGGVVVFDDYTWSLNTSPTMNPQAFPDIVHQYTSEQLAARQVQMVVDLLVKTDPRYVELIPNVAYQKVEAVGD